MLAITAPMLDHVGHHGGHKLDLDGHECHLGGQFARYVGRRVRILRSRVRFLTHVKPSAALSLMLSMFDFMVRRAFTF